MDVKIERKVMGGALGELGIMIGDDGRPKRVIVIRCPWRMEQLQETIKRKLNLEIFKFFIM